MGKTAYTTLYFVTPESRLAPPRQSDVHSCYLRGDGGREAKEDFWYTRDTCQLLRLAFKSIIIAPESDFLTPRSPYLRLRERPCLGLQLSEGVSLYSTQKAPSRSSLVWRNRRRKNAFFASCTASNATCNSKQNWAKKEYQQKACYQPAGSLKRCLSITSWRQSHRNSADEFFFFLPEQC